MLACLLVGIMFLLCCAVLCCAVQCMLCPVGVGAPAPPCKGKRISRESAICLWAASWRRPLWFGLVGGSAACRMFGRSPFVTGLSIHLSFLWLALPTRAYKGGEEEEGMFPRCISWDGVVSFSNPSCQPKLVLAFWGLGFTHTRGICGLSRPCWEERCQETPPPPCASVTC